MHMFIQPAPGAAIICFNNYEDTIYNRNYRWSDRNGIDLYHSITVIYLKITQFVFYKDISC